MSLTGDADLPQSLDFNKAPLTAPETSVATVPGHSF